MPTPDVLILRAPGTNCDRETAFAFEQAGAQATVLHVNRLLEAPDRLDRYQVLCVPGGFSFGDDLAAGRILAARFRHHLADPIRRFIDNDRLVLGICNGFQVLMKSGILVDANDRQVPEATLTMNDSGRFEDRWVRLSVESEHSVFLRGIERMELPVAHAEGKFVPRDETTLGSMRQAGRLVLRYRAAEENGSDDCPYPDNPNGSVAHIAGVADRTGRVLGLMPHPERHVTPLQHPRWTRGEAGPVGDGLAVFQNAVTYFG